MEDYNIDANVEMPVVTKEVGKDGSSIQEIVSSAVSAAVSAAIAQRPNRKPNIQDITVNIGSAGSATRLYGCIVDTLGGTYRLLLENCRLLSAAEQDNMEFEDDCAGDSIPSVIVPVSAIAGDIGSASIDESMYNMHSLLGIIDDNKSNSTDIVAGGEMSVQAGSLIMFCVEPIDSSVPCRLHFLTTQEKGRVFTNPNDASLLFRVFQGGNAGSGESGSGDGDNGGSGNGESGGDGNVTVNSVEVAIITEDDGDYTSSLTSEQIAESIEDGVPVFVLGDMNGIAFNSSNVMFHAESSNVFAYITTPAGIYKMTIGTTGEVEVEVEEEAAASADTELLVETTWAQLKALRDGGNLVAGQHYRITDYQCTTSQANTQSAGHQFDIIVVADDESTLNENARAIMHDGDQYFTGCKLSAWKLLYCLDNDSSRFAWAQAGSEGGNGSITFDVDKNYVTATFVEEIEDGKDHYIAWSYNDGKDDVTVYTSAPCSVGDTVYSDSGLSTSISSVVSMEGGEPVPAGKGVIYRMIDEYLNDLPYDFKNIQFRRWAITDITNGNLTTEALSNLQQTFVKSQNNGLYFAWSPEMSIYGCTATVDSSDSTFYYTFGGASDQSIVAPSGGIGCYCNSMKRYYEDKGSLQTLNANVFLGSNCHSNTFGNYYYSNTFGNGVGYNTFGNYCNRNTFGNECKGNTFGNYYYSNTFGNYFQNNTFGNNCYSNTFGNGFQLNTFGNDCWNNTFGNNCGSNTFGNGVGYNTFGNYYYSNTFGNECKGNTFGNSCNQNTFGNYCNRNTFGNDCNQNTFGNDCYYNTFGNNCYSNTFGNYYYSNTFGNGVGGNTFGNDCYSNTFGNGFQLNTFGNYVRQLTVFDGVMYCAIVGGSDSSSYVQNAQILNGTKGDDANNLLTITFVANSNSTQCAAKNSSGTLKVWYAADLVA